jgi:transcriptional regulator with XRE-family HTH domain
MSPTAGREAGTRPTQLGKVVKAYRESMGMTQTRLGELAGVNGSYISMLEGGQRGSRPERDTVLKLAEALGAPPYEFLDAAGRLEPTDTRSDRVMPSFAEVVNADPSLRPDQRNALISIYHAFRGGA